jgi:hypothetical protein
LKHQKQGYKNVFVLEQPKAGPLFRPFLKKNVMSKKVDLTCFWCSKKIVWTIRQQNQACK